MTGYTHIKRLLSELLDELHDEDLREFQWCMGLSENVQPIPLKDATRKETVDKLVQEYGELHAVVTTERIFNWMKREDLVRKLLEAHTDRISKEQSSKPAPVAASGSANYKDADLISSELSCGVCLYIFTDPVILECGHSFCKDCVHKCPKCPLCRKVIRDTPFQSFTLKSLSENYREGKLFQPSGGHRDESHQPPEKTEERPEAFEQGQRRKAAATVHNFHPNYTAQRESSVVAPSFIGCNIKNVNIKTLTSNGEGETVHCTVQYCDSSAEQSLQSVNTAASQYCRNPCEDALYLEEDDALVWQSQQSFSTAASHYCRNPCEDELYLEEEDALVWQSLQSFSSITVPQEPI